MGDENYPETLSVSESDQEYFKLNELAESEGLNGHFGRKCEQLNSRRLLRFVANCNLFCLLSLLFIF